MAAKPVESGLGIYQETEAAGVPAFRFSVTLLSKVYNLKSDILRGAAWLRSTR
jgi:hypothetical protein